jgi:protein TonB
VADDEALHPKTGTGELVTNEQQPAEENNGAVDAEIRPGNIDIGLKRADSAIIGAVTATGSSQSERTQATTELPSVDAPNPAAEAAPLKEVADDETLHPKTAGGGMVDKEKQVERSTENQFKAGRSPQPVALPATKYPKNEGASASPKRTHGVKPAAPGLRRAATEMGSELRSKPFTLGTAGRLLPGKASNRRASESDYATKVRQALGRHQAKSVGPSGSVTVSFAIGTHGTLRGARVSRSSGKPQLDRAALAIMRKAAPFPRPARGDQPTYTITINFR